MSKIEAFKNAFDQIALASFDVVKKVATNPSAVKKGGQITTNIIAAIDYAKNKKHIPELVRTIKGTNDLIGIYGFIKDIMYWACPFTVNRLNQNKLVKTLDRALEVPDRHKKDQLIQQVVQNVLAKARANATRKQVRALVEESLVNGGVQPIKAKEITEQVKITAKSRPIFELLSMGCYTVVDCVSNLRLFQRWGLVDFSKWAAVAGQIGNKFPIFAFVVKIPVDLGLSVVASVGMVFSLTDAGLRLIRVQIELHKKREEDEMLSEEECKKLKLETQRAIWDIVTNALDLAATAIPLAVVLNPPVLIGFALLSKGVGLIAIFLRP